MNKEISDRDILGGIQKFLEKYCDHENIKVPKFTSIVYYKHGKGSGAFKVIVNSEKEKEKCVNLLCKMLQREEEQTSNAFNTEELGFLEVGAVATESMVILVAGLDHSLAKAVIAKMLLDQNAISSAEYKSIKDSTNVFKWSIFETLEKE